MTPVIPYSISNVSLIPGTVFTTRKNYSSTRFSLSRKTTINTSCPQIFLLSRSASFRLLPPYGRECSLHNQSRIHLLRATGADVAVEEPDSPVAGEDSGEATAEVKSDATPAPAQSKRSRPVNKSKMPRVKNEELVAGAIFTGKVMTIQPFGAFVDFGAFTDGLIHVSQLTGSFVKDVSSVVSVGQEVKVRLIEANMKTGRISLSMCEGDNSGKGQQQKESSGGYERGGPGRRNASKSGQRKDEPKKVSKFVKGQDLEGTVKNMNRAGAFITLPEGEEGFLPISEELGDGFRTMMGETTLEVGQEVSVRVLRISRGQVTLTMKKEEDIQKMEIQVGQGVVHTATNPFLLAFRKNKDIAAFLDEREKKEKAAEKPVVPTVSEEPEKEVVSESVSDCPEGQNQPVISNEVTIDVPSAADEKLETDEASSESAQLEASALEEPATDISESKEEPDTSILSTAGSIDSEVQTTEETEVSAEIENAEASVSAEEAIAKEASSVDAEESNGIAEPADQRVSSESSTGDVVAEQEAKDATVKDEPSVKENKDPLIKDEVAEQQSDDATIKDELPVQEANDATVKNEVAEQQTDDATVKQQSDDAIVKDELPVQEANDATYKNEVAEQQADDATVKDEVAEQQAEDATVKDEVAEQEAEDATVKEQQAEDATVKDEVAEQEAEDATVKDELPVQQAEDATVKDELPVETPPAENEDSSSTPTENGATPNSDNNGSVGNSGVQPDNAPSQAAKATISPALVKQLREETGAGMMDCKKALSESGGDIVKAQEYLRKKGLASAEKKASRATAEGRIGSYIHDSRIGVLVEVNCETDFVSRGEIFKELVDDLAMQVVACPQVHYVVTEDVPKEIVNKEQEIEMQKEDLLSKPEQIRLKIVEGRIKKRLDELALLEQPYIKNDKVLIKDWVKQTIATIGENINVKRFVRYNLGEGLEKKSQDFAAEVAAQTSTKLVPKEQPAAVPEANETVEKPPTVTVSAALVKQLREETGAGMMDCKKALSETGGDIEKAQEYLRKKGLSSAEKKSSRLAAEGRIGSYIHDSRIGVLIEVNCETDFVGRSEKFKELVDDLAMQAVACPQVQFVSIEDIGEEIVKKEKEIEMQRDDLQSKPENIREKIVEGRVSKRLGELALLEQPFIKNDSILVKDLVKQTVAALGENIKVRRFVRFTLGETAAGDAKAESKT